MPANRFVLVQVVDFGVCVCLVVDLNASACLQLAEFNSECKCLPAANLVGLR